MPENFEVSSSRKIEILLDEILRLVYSRPPGWEYMKKSLEEEVEKLSSREERHHF